MQVDIPAKRVKKMFKDVNFFAVRNEIFKDKDACASLLQFLEAGRSVFPLTVVTNVSDCRIYCEAPFKQNHKTYDLTKVTTMDQPLKEIAISEFLEAEGEQSIFFNSEEQLRIHLQSILSD